MFSVLSEGFKNATDKLKGKATLNEENIKDALSAVRTSLLEADVEYGVVQKFLEKVKTSALGQDVQLKAGSKAGKIKVSAGDHFVSICQKELEDLMGPGSLSFELPKNRPAIIMMVGLQGVGKTTTVAKLAHYLKAKQKRKPLLVAADIHRAAAVKQLEVLGQRLGTPVFHIPGASTIQICKEALKEAYAKDCDAIILDTAGRLSIDDALMEELEIIKKETKPDQILLVCDGLMGQDAVNTAKAFNDRLSIDGFIMTKLDGDSRGGAALSIKEVTGKPIKFLGMGEEIERLEEFRPEGLASRILGMGDIVGLMEDFERASDGDKEEEAMRLLSGQFTFYDFYEQISMIQKMGPIKDILAKLPMQNMLPKGLDISDKDLKKVKVMIDSMTKQERNNPSVINHSRIKRIAKGSGRSMNEVSDLIKRFMSMRSMMGGFGKKLGGMMGKIPGMGTLNQMNQMRQMMKNPGAMPDLGSMMNSSSNPFSSNASFTAEKKPIDRDKLKKARKQAKDSRKKNRK